MPSVLRRSIAVAAVPLVAVTLAGCGESSQEKAKAEVCSGRSEISKQVAKLEGLSISSSFLTEAKTSIEAIDKSVTKIKEAEPNLEPAVKQQVETGTKTFQVELAAIGAGLAKAATSGNIEAELKTAEPQLKAATKQLSSSYKQAYASLNCS